MFDDIENLKLLNSSVGKSKPFSKINGRKTNSFSFRTGGAGIFKFADKEIVVHEGEMIFLPKGASYTFTAISEESTYTYITFEADLKNAVPTLYSLEEFSEAHYIEKSFPNLWNLGSQSEKYQCLSLFYSLLSYLSNIENLKYSDKKKFSIIAPALDFLKLHIYDCSLKVDCLHTLCGISDTYFRKIFVARFGMSPQKYIINKRLSRAKAIIDSGDFDSISEVSESVGYSDPLHFSRVFKQKYGLSPATLSKA